jgi:S-adenosylmethionine/arginine decarboxylase-like enzyme
MIARPAVKEEIAPWGILTSLDIYDCNPEIIRDADQIKRYVIELCELIEMKRFGECQVVHFGEDERVAGFSMIQLIETSLISGHFANLTNAAYIDVFSCKAYDSEKVAEFTQRFFQGKTVQSHVARRM